VALRQKFTEAIATIDFVELGQDVQNFLFNPADVRKVEAFREFIAETPLH
jgi:hypothetical protein